MTKQDVIDEIAAFLACDPDPELPSPGSASDVYDQMPITLAATSGSWSFTDLVRLAGHDVWRAMLAN